MKSQPRKAWRRRLPSLLAAAVLAAAGGAWGAEPPYYLQSTASPRDVGGVNENDRALSDAIRKTDLTQGGTVDGNLTVDAAVFPDGTSQSTAFRGYGSTETWGGAQTYTSSGTWGSTTYTSTATTGPGATAAGSSYLVNSWMIVASTNPSAASHVFLTGLQSNKAYRLRFAFLHNTTDGEYTLRFNHDSGNNYKHAVRRVDDAGTLASDVSASASSVQLAGDTQLVNATNGVRCLVEFQTEPSDGTRVHVDTINCDYIDGNAVLQSLRGGGYYDGSASLANLSILASAGSFTGQVYLEQLIAPLP